ncbi:MAG TPA: phospholipase [Candidatus Anammoximicrobium sp.]|nr:phospholipase [Candidatus Anammoximicrobium sp.]
MNVSAEVLRDLHRIHHQLTDLKDRLQKGPMQVRIGHQAVEHTQNELAAAKEAAKRTRMEADEKQLSLREREAKVADWQRKLNEAQSNAEFRALKDQIAADKAANAVLEDEILDRLEKLDEIQKHVHDAEVKLARAREELEKAEARVANEQTSLHDDLARIKSQLKHAEAALPPDFRTEYERIVKARGEASLAQVEGESCGNCNTMLTPQIMNQLFLSKPIFCKSCGCMLYLAEGAVQSGKKR